MPRGKRTVKKNEVTGPEVLLTADAFAETDATLADALKRATGAEKPRVLLVADYNVVQQTAGLGTKIGAYVQKYGIELAGAPIVFSGGEKIKGDGFQTAFKIVSAAVGANLGANDCVLALGGGALFDVAGWVAAQIRGGVRIVRMPTTPSAMMDGAFATYAAVNASGTKDALAVASVPSAIVIDTAFAHTVLDGVWRTGFAEALRQALGRDEKLVRRLCELAERIPARDTAAMDEIVRAVVALRQTAGASPLALWCAASLETLSGWKLPHGYAVTLGVAFEAMYAREAMTLTGEDWNLVSGALNRCGAMDGAQHSRGLFGEPRFTEGWKSWRLRAGSGNYMRLTGLGTADAIPEPEVGTMNRARDLIK